MRVSYRHILIIALVCCVVALVLFVMGLVRPTPGPTRIVVPVLLLFTGLLALFLGAALRELTERVDKLESSQREQR